MKKDNSIILIMLVLLSSCGVRSASGPPAGDGSLPIGNSSSEVDVSKQIVGRWELKVSRTGEIYPFEVSSQLGRTYNYVETSGKVASIDTHRAAGVVDSLELSEFMIFNEPGMQAAVYWYRVYADGSIVLDSHKILRIENNSFVLGTNRSSNDETIAILRFMGP